MSAINRIYNINKLSIHAEIILSSKEMHYITKVLRLRINNNIKIFNETDGEYLARISTIDKKSCSLLIHKKLRSPEIQQHLNLAMAIIKQDKMGLVIEKATELGVTAITPVITDRCQIRKINHEKLSKIIIEATEQSNRITPPKLLDIIGFEDIITKENLLVLNERSPTNNKINHKIEKEDITLLIGPEGGFSDKEHELISTLNSVSLGHNILRAETAAISALAIIQNNRNH